MVVHGQLSKHSSKSCIVGTCTKEIGISLVCLRATKSSLRQHLSEGRLVEMVPPYIESIEFIEQFTSCFEPHYVSKASCIVSITKVSFYSSVNKTNFHIQSFARGPAFEIQSNLGNDLLNVERNRPFPSYCEPHCESESKCKNLSYEI